MNQLPDVKKTIILGATQQTFGFPYFVRASAVLIYFLYGNVLPSSCTHLHFCLYVLGAFCKWLPDEDLSNIIDDVLLNSAGNDSDWQIKHGRSAALYVAMKGTKIQIMH